MNIMNIDTYINLIDYFRFGISDESFKEVDFAKINELAVKLGYIIHPDCCNEIVFKWLKSLTMNYNSTFYKEWTDVLSKSRMEIFVDQILHYATTYGTDFQCGNGYVPNDGSIVPSFEKLTVIKPITKDEIFTKCLNVLNSGIALKQSTCNTFCDFISMYANAYDDNFKISTLSDIKNKEAQCILSSEFNVLPNDEFGILRCLVYSITGSSMLIKSKLTITEIKNNLKYDNSKPLISNLTDYQVERLSRIFYRFKPIFLAMKNKYSASTINRIRRLAKKNHTPFKIGFWENIISTKRPLTEVCRKLEELDNFRKIRLMMIIKERIMFETKNGIFIIRNGKVFFRENYTPKYDINYLGDLFMVIKSSLVNSLAKKSCKVKLPKHINLVLPSSEKTFVGNYPFGCNFEMSKNNIVGVYWRNEWGTRDYDFSMVDYFGRLISWRGQYESNGVVYSGDMTNADPEASEMFFIKDSCPDAIIKLNKYSGNNKSKFRFYYANEVAPETEMNNYMVNPNNIKFDTMIDFSDTREKTIGMVSDNKFYFMDFGSGNSRVSYSGKYAEMMIDSFKRKLCTFINLRDILECAKFEILDETDERTPDIDFTNLEKDTFINLLSNN